MKVHLRVALKRCLEMFKIVFFLSQVVKLGIPVNLASDLMKTTSRLFRNRNIPTTFPHRKITAKKGYYKLRNLKNLLGAAYDRVLFFRVVEVIHQGAFERTNSHLCK